MKLMIINGPNLNLLGIREPAHYGRETYADLVAKIRHHCEKKGVEVTLFQSNHEGVHSMLSTNGMVSFFPFAQQL